MTYPKTKPEIIQLILEDCNGNPDFPWKDMAVDKLVFEWFASGRSGSGLRLSDKGKMALESAAIAHYDFDFSSKNKLSDWPKFTYTLDKKIKCPYYIGIRLVENARKQPYIRVYDHKIAMMLSLYGNVDEYIESVK